MSGVPAKHLRMLKRRKRRVSVEVIDSPARVACFVLLYLVQTDPESACVFPGRRTSPGCTSLYPFQWVPVSQSKPSACCCPACSAPPDQFSCLCHSEKMKQSEGKQTLNVTVHQKPLREKNS